MRFLVLLLVLLIACSINASSVDNVTISGSAKEYANMHLIVECQKNYITRDFKELKGFFVNEEGDFEVSFYLEETTKVLIKLGETEVFLFAQPEVNYQVVFPPYKPLKPENRLNLFFVRERVLMGVMDEKSFNANIKVLDFEAYYNQKFAANIQRIVLTNNRKLAQSIIDETEIKFHSKKGSWFDDYKQYSYVNLDNFIYANKVRVLIKKSFTDKKVSYTLKPYWDSFNQVFSNFFYNYFSSNYGAELKQKWETAESFDTLVSTLSKDTLFYQRNLAELVVLKGLYDGFYSGYYDEEKVINLVKKAEEECVKTENREIASDILKKIIKLRMGTHAPAIGLPTLSGKQKELEDFRGKFVYLNFANTQNYACKKDFQVLEEFADMYKRDMVIVTILMDEDPDEAAKYVKKNKFRWTFLYFNHNGKVLTDYAVKGYPTYYLIDPEGNLVYSPAPAPEENFVPMFQEIYNEYRYKKLRKEKPKERTIYDL